MDFFDALILGALQGITEFLPISSSGHLVIAEEFLGLNTEGLKAFDVGLHIATLLAIFIYFKRDIFGLIKAFLNIFTGNFSKKDEYSSLMFYIIIGTIPAGVIGVLFEDQIDSYFRDTSTVAVSMIIVGVIFITGEYVYKKLWKNEQEFTWYKALIIGLAQAVALAPGISRSGSTIVAGIFQGIERSKAARFSFLLSIPAVLGAGVLTGLNLSSTDLAVIKTAPMLVGFISAFLFGVFSISFLMRFLKNNTLLIFALYLIFIGLFVIF